MSIGFLSPKGEFYECTSWGHSSKAVEIYEQLYGEHYYGSAEKFLLGLGYLVLRARDAYRESWHDGKFVALTDRQMEWLSGHSEAFNDDV
ncbi:MAG: hypothetical protein ACYDG2_01730, partial [Ruminiclostridium sp.]